MLCWCCWSPGWFLWRVGVCRFLPCCNSACASCQLCGRSCVRGKDHRLAKVGPHLVPDRTPDLGPDRTGAEDNVPTVAL